MISRVNWRYLARRSSTRLTSRNKGDFSQLSLGVTIKQPISINSIMEVDNRPLQDGLSLQDDHFLPLSTVIGGRASCVLLDIGTVLPP